VHIDTRVGRLERRRRCRFGITRNACWSWTRSIQPTALAVQLFRYRLGARRGGHDTASGLFRDDAVCLSGRGRIRGMVVLQLNR